MYALWVKQTDSLHIYIMQVTKQWYDYERSTFYFVQVLQNLKEPVVLKHTTDFDQNGLFYWLGSNARWRGEWMGQGLGG